MELTSRLRKSRKAARELRAVPVDVRNKVLKTAAELLLTGQDRILKANQQDLKALPADTAAAFRDRLTLDIKRLGQMAASLIQVAELPDPLEGASEKHRLPNGLMLKKIRSPLGVIFMIYESRPNVAVEAFSMGFKSGNAMILRGGKESQKTVSVLYELLHEALEKNGLPPQMLWGITDPDRALVKRLLTEKDFIDVVVPRGGDRLIEFVVKNSRIPIIKNDRGLCHVYVHADAAPDMALSILVNAKTQRPAVCNSMETMLVHRSLAASLLPQVYEAMKPFGVQWYGDPSTLKILGRENVKRATRKSWDTEYLDQAVNCRVVSSLDEALEHIDLHGSRHSESIVTWSQEAARRFQNEVDAAVVYWNASTRFTDGFEFGLGGELGISTQKLHVRGPVGLKALTCERWIADGSGQIRQ